jgi:hypothetical protein
VALLPGKHFFHSVVVHDEHAHVNRFAADLQSPGGSPTDISIDSCRKRPKNDKEAVLDTIGKKALVLLLSRCTNPDNVL